MGFETYVIANTNQMNQLLVRAEIEANLDSSSMPRSILEASVIGCRTLQQLSDDSDFRKTVRELQDPRTTGRGKAAQEFQKVLDDVASFERFLNAEQEVLVKGGVIPDLADKMIRECRAAISILIVSPIPRDRAVEAVRTLRDQACERSRVLTAEAVNAENVDEMESQMWKITMGICGAGMIGLNAVLTAKAIFVSAGFETVGSNLSSVLGGLILSNATTSAPRSRSAGGGL